MAFSIRPFRPDDLPALQQVRQAAFHPGMKEAGARVATVGTGGDPSHAPVRRAYEKVVFGAAIPSVYLYKLL